MRRPTRPGLAILAALLATAGAYTIYWYVVAGEITEGVIAWAQAARADKIDVSWQKIEVTGSNIKRVDQETEMTTDNLGAPLRFISPVLRSPAPPGPGTSTIGE
jgi:hypothetical protein